MKKVLLLITVLFFACSNEPVETLEQTKEACTPHCPSEPHNGNCWTITPSGMYKHCIIPPYCNDKDN